MDFITAMPEVFAWERPSAGDWLIYSANAPRPPSPSGTSVLCLTLVAAAFSSYCESEFYYLAVWLISNGVGYVNKFTLHPARLVLGWVTIFRWESCYSQWGRLWVLAKVWWCFVAGEWDDSFHLWINLCVADSFMWFVINICHTWMLWGSDSLQRATQVSCLLYCLWYDIIMMTMQVW